MSASNQLQPPFTGLSRIEGGVYMEEFVPLHVQTLLGVVKRHLDLECVVSLFRKELESWHRILLQNGGMGDVDSCCAIAPPLQYQSINMGRRMSSFTENHKVIMEAIKETFGVSYRECKGHLTARSRIYDLCGSRLSLTCFVPVFDFLLGGYELVMFMQLRQLRCSKSKKMEVRRAATRAFVDALRHVCRELD